MDRVSIISNSPIFLRISFIHPLFSIPWNLPKIVRSRRIKPICNCNSRVINFVKSTANNFSIQSFHNENLYFHNFLYPEIIILTFTFEYYTQRRRRRNKIQKHHVRFAPSPMFKLEPTPKKRNSMEGFNLETNRSRQRSRELSGSRTRWRDNPRGGIIIGCFSGLETGREKYEAPHVLSQTVSAHARLMLHLAHVHYEH